MILIDKAYTKQIGGGCGKYTETGFISDMIELQYVAEVPDNHPSQVTVYTCPAKFLWYCVDQNFGGLCSLAGGGLSTEPDGSVTCTVY